ncbi:MAG TPA: hypothetical protein VGI83_04420 [Gemmatimonadales bacterium]|jgi:hypothetical protein
MRQRWSVVLAGAALSAVAVSARGQTPPAAPNPYPPLAAGAVAPDFALSGSTRFGVIKNLVHLSDFKGKTVVLAFYFRARTRG